MDDFEVLLRLHKGALERFVRYKLQSAADAEDVLQEVYLAGYEKFHTLRDKAAFKAWMLSIARSKVNDYFRAKAKRLDLPLDAMGEAAFTDSRTGPAETVRETLALLGDKEKQMLYLYYFKDLPQKEIAQRLNLPLGTVKSRLHAAKARFEEKYPYSPRNRKGETTMRKLPEYLPEYTIMPKEEAPFPVKWEELMGWFIVPKAGEKISWAMYDMPSRKRDCAYALEVTGRAEVHGIEGVEIAAREEEPGRTDTLQRTFVAQLTESRCRYLAAMRTEDGVRKYITFLDEAFAPNWAFGENACGNETNLMPKGDVIRSGNTVTAAAKPWLLDVVGRYDVTINGRTYDTVCLINIDKSNGDMISEQFVDKDGRTILWRRYNRDDWALDLYGGKPWSEQLPQNEKLTVNGTTYVQWYDCITDHIL